MHIPSWRPIDGLNADWAALAASPASKEALARLARAEPTVAALGVEDLGELVAVLTGHGRGRKGGRRRASPETGAAVLRAMLRSQGVDPLVPRAILQAILPGLVGVARRLGWGSGGEWGDGGAFLADAMATAWQVVAEWSGQDRPYAVLDILSAVRCRLRRQLLRHAASREVPTGDVASEPVAAGLGAHSARSDVDELARAIDAQWGTGPLELDAAVLYAHRVLGYSLAELSQLTSRSRRYLRDHRDQAVEALIA